MQCYKWLAKFTVKWSYLLQGSARLLAISMSDVKYGLTLSEKYVMFYTISFMLSSLVYAMYVTADCKEAGKEIL